MGATVWVQHRQSLTVTQIPADAFPAFEAEWRELTAAQAAFELKLRAGEGVASRTAATTPREDH